MTRTAAASRLPDRTPASLEERKVECAKMIKMVLLEFELPSVPRPSLMEEESWAIFQGCLSCSVSVTDYAETETMEKMVWLYQTIVIVSSSVHEQFGMEVPVEFHGLMKTTCLLKPLVDHLRTLHGY